MKEKLKARKAQAADVTEAVEAPAPEKIEEPTESSQEGAKDPWLSDFDNTNKQ